MTKQRTLGLSPKVPSQAFATLIAFVLAKYGISLDTEVSGALALVIGWIAGFFAPPGEVEDPPLVTDTPGPVIDHSGDPS